MAVILNDKEIENLIDKVIIDGDTSCIRPNSYILRLGAKGEFLNTGKEFSLGKEKKGIRVPPGHSVGLTAYETLDFRRDAVHLIYPDHDLHGIVSPTTDLSREGIVAPTTQVDAGYHGTLNWTISNTSNEERRFIYQEQLFRLMIIKLAEGETPDRVYDGAYQDQTGYVRSRRSGAPVGMKDSEWENATVKGGPEDLLDNLLKSGYPWHVLGQRLKIIDQQFKSVTDEYAEIKDSINNLTTEVDKIRKDHSDFVYKIPSAVKEALKEEASSLQNRWLIGAGSILMALIGLVLAITSNEIVFSFFKQHGVLFGIILLILGVIPLLIISKK